MANKKQKLEITGKTLAQFINPEGEPAGPLLHLPTDARPEQLTLLLNKLLENEEPLPYSFSVSDTEISSSIKEIMEMLGKSTEQTLEIVYQPQAIFKVRAVSRCTSSLAGHSEAILSVVFSPDGTQLATGSGDTTVRLWDLATETPQHTLKGHKNWVQIVSWSPDGETLVSGSMDNTIIIWDPKKGCAVGEPLRAHKQCITSIAWEPMHLNARANRFVSTSKDATTRIWDSKTRKCELILSQHTLPVMTVKWAGDGLIYTGSRDKTIKVWSPNTGTLVRQLSGHAHWINHLALSSDFILRTGPFDHTDRKFKTREEMFQRAKERYEEFIKTNGKEMLASGSDDFTIFLWELGSKKPISQMTGHQQLVNHLSFSPNGQILASASFDKHVKLWDGKTGKFRTTLKGHVGAVYQVCWSSDSRQVLSGSRDSTLKVWELRTNKLKMDLPGHADEVFSVDWSPGGDKVASGGKDRILKM